MPPPSAAACLTSWASGGAEPADPLTLEPGQAASVQIPQLQLEVPRSEGLVTDADRLDAKLASALP